VVGGGSTVTFTYDGDGNRVKKDEDGIVTLYPGRHYEFTKDSGSTKYFPSTPLRTGFADGQLVSFERSPDYGVDNGRRFVFRDHPSISLRTCLGSTSVIVNGRGEKLWEDRYLPGACPERRPEVVSRRGDVRYTYRKEQEPGLDIVLQTQFRYTSQWFEDGLGASAKDGLDRGLYFYGARWYDSSLGRFVQPDTIVPNPGDPQSLNRYSSVLNNPVKFTDPTGHSVCASEDCNLVWHPVSENVMVRDVGSSALYRLIRRLAKGQDSAANRLDEVLRETGSPVPAQFSGLGGVRGDAGFATEFRDDHLYGELWGYSEPSSRQLGHFLTAVLMGYESNERVRSAYLRVIVAHEQKSDGKGLFGQGAGLVRQGAKSFINGPYVDAFKNAVDLDIAGESAARDAALYTIYDPARYGEQASRVGNSMEDLRLSVRGWRLGTVVREGGLSTNQNLANWLVQFGVDNYIDRALPR